ncbi:DUF374 domain-containing protein [bacterium]|nr:DUF374 domain-containing protein [bacterium]
MVRLINNKNIPVIANFAYRILKIQEFFTYIRNWGHPDIEQCIYVMWHANQFSVHGLPNRSKTNVLISTSLDGQIVATVCENWGFKVCRGSAGNKGAISSTLKMLGRLKEGDNVAIMVDGPRGPYHSVKKGAITLSKESGIPIVPVYWYSEDFTFRKLPSWDKMICPIGPCRILNIYGKPIYSQNKTEEDLINEVKNSLLKLEESAGEIYKEAKRQKLWNKKQ